MTLVKKVLPENPINIGEQHEALSNINTTTNQNEPFNHQKKND